MTEVPACPAEAALPLQCLPLPRISMPLFWPPDLVLAMPLPDGRPGSSDGGGAESVMLFALIDLPSQACPDGNTTKKDCLNVLRSQQIIQQIINLGTAQRIPTTS